MEPLDYNSPATPKEYTCSACGAIACKLWRQYQTLADAVELLCAPCAAKDQKESIAGIGADGRHPSDIGMGPVDPIGWLVPAIPTEDGETYWGYTSVPQGGVDWWRGLPTLPAVPVGEPV